MKQLKVYGIVDKKPLVVNQGVREKRKSRDLAEMKIRVEDAKERQVLDVLTKHRASNPVDTDRVSDYHICLAQYGDQCEDMNIEQHPSEMSEIQCADTKSLIDDFQFYQSIIESDHK